MSNKNENADVEVVEAVEVFPVNPDNFGVQKSQATELLGNLPLVKQEREALQSEYNEVISLDIEDENSAKRARELRLKIMKNRTKGILDWHTRAKAVFLRGGQFVDAIKKHEEAINETMEEKLREIEKHAENKEKERKEKLLNVRMAAIEPYKEFIPSALFPALADMEDQDFIEMILDPAKLKSEEKAKRVEEKRKADELAKIQSELRQQRASKLLPYRLSEEVSKMDFGILSEEEFSNILNETVLKNKQEDEESERLRKEKEESERKLAEAKELANQEKKKREEESARLQKENQEKIDAIKRDQEAKNRKIQEENDRLEREKKEAQERLDKLQKEQKDREAAEEIKRKSREQMPIRNWLMETKMPELKEDSPATIAIRAKFDGFKSWAIKQLENE